MAFDGPRGLAELLARSEQVYACTARRFLEYALEGQDAPPVIPLQQELPLPPSEPPRQTPVQCFARAFASSRVDFRSLLFGLATSGLFKSSATQFELRSLGASGNTPLEHAASNAALLASDITSQVPGEAPELQSYADALAALAREAP